MRRFEQEVAERTEDLLVKKATNSALSVSSCSNSSTLLRIRLKAGGVQLFLNRHHDGVAESGFAGFFS